jgi:hypothetical protein
VPRDEGAEVGDGERKRFIDENGQAGFDEGTRTLHVIKAIIGRDEHRVDVADNIRRARDNMRNQRRGGDGWGFVRAVGPEMRDARSRNAH